MSDADRIELGRFAGRFELKAAAAAGQDEGFFTGHGALFSVPHPTSSWMLDDDWMDVFAPGAFKRTLAEHKANATRPAMLLQHERGQIIGAWRDFSEDKSGLYLEGQLTMGKQLGRDVHADMKNQALDALSVGFRAVKAELDEAKKTRTLLDVDLGEVSVVDIGGCPGARVSDIKSSSTRPDITKRYLEGVLRDAGLSRDEAKALIADGFDRGLGLRDADPSGLVAAVLHLTQTIRPRSER